MPTKRTRNEFEDPVEGKPPEEGHGHGEAFEPPADAATLAVEAGDAEMEAALAQVDARILSAKAELEKLLADHARAEVGIQSAEVMEANIVGVGIGLGDPAAGAPPGEPSLEVYTIEPSTEAEMKARLASAAGVSALAEQDFPLNVVCTGIIDAQPHRMRMRPAPGGISVGHFRITAGTLGCLVRGRTARRVNRLMILSNNHVLANSNAAAIGDCVAQPGPIDGGRCPADQVAVLERFVPINFAGGANVVDCATAWAWPDRVRRELMTSAAAPRAPSARCHAGSAGARHARRQERAHDAIDARDDHGGRRDDQRQLRRADRAFRRSDRDPCGQRGLQPRRRFGFADLDLGRPARSSRAAVRGWRRDDVRQPHHPRAGRARHPAFHVIAGAARE